MRYLRSLSCLLPSILLATALPTSINLSNSSSISPELFESLEELARIVDISYCIGTTGIQKPFKCVSRCHEFEGFELVEQWKTGVLMSDSCGYIALSHPPFPKRIVVAFRGTYSITNTVVDLSTNPAEYLPYPSDDEETCMTTSDRSNAQLPFTDPSDPSTSSTGSTGPDEPCMNCTVHAGFLSSWKNTRCIIIPLLEKARAQYPDYQVTLVGHSLGGAVAAIASLEFLARGWEPQVTTFGEPRIGNQALMDYIDRRFKMSDQEARERTFRRVTHVNDPVPLLPLEEWGYKMHSGEIFISKPDLSPGLHDIHHCLGDEDPACIAGSSPSPTSSRISSSTATPTGATSNPTSPPQPYLSISDLHALKSALTSQQQDWQIPNRYRLWELFFAHRDYFWRLGLCVPGGDPKDWWREPYHHEEGEEGEEENMMDDEF